MKDPAELLEKIIIAFQGALPDSLGEDIKKNIMAIVSQSLKELDVVTREELEVQISVLNKTKEKLDILQQRIDELENQL